MLMLTHYCISVYLARRFFLYEFYRRDILFFLFYYKFLNAYAFILPIFKIISILLVLCGALFYKVKNDIAGFQNRMGVLFFMCALFGFGCLTSLHVFAAERIIFVKERANGYYSPITYFSSKVCLCLLYIYIYNLKENIF